MGQDLLICEQQRNELLREKLEYMKAEEKRLLAEAAELANRKDHHK